MDAMTLEFHLFTIMKSMHSGHAHKYSKSDSYCHLIIPTHEMSDVMQTSLMFEGADGSESKHHLKKKKKRKRQAR